MTTSNHILFDTNILVYNQDAESEFYKKASALHDQVFNNELNAAVSLQNFTEFISVITNKNRIPNPLTVNEARAEVEKYIESQAYEIIFPTIDTAQVFLKLLKKYGSKNNKHIFDIFLVATMISNNISKILTANYKDFETFEEIEVLSL